MKIALRTDSFAFFKVVTGFVFLALATIFQNYLVFIFTLIPLMVGKAHSLGAYLAMWRANKLNWKYVSFVAIISLLFLWLGSYVFSYKGLLVVTYVLFAFHFLFDEFDLQQQKMDFANIISPFFLFLQLVLYVLFNFFEVNISFYFFLAMTVFSILLESIFIKEITWFFVNIKMLSFFVLYCIFAKIDPFYLFSMILTFHYFFWFIYPVYKIHKFKREERDGFIMILLIIVVTNIFFTTTRVVSTPELFIFAVKFFSIFTIVHILTTAPFGYYIGLPRPKYHL